MQNTQMSMFLVKSGGQNEPKILFRMFQNKLDILVIEAQNSQRFFKISLTEESLSGAMGAYFDTIKDMFEFFKQQKHESIVFKADIVEDQLQKIPEHFIYYEIPIGIKVMKKRFQLTEHKSSETLYETTKLEINELEKVDITRARVEEKKKKLKELKDQFTQITSAIKLKDEQIEKIEKEIQSINTEIVNKQNETQDIRKEYVEKNKDKYEKHKHNERNERHERNAIELARNQQLAASAGAPSASMIFEEMPESFELNPLGKHVEMHNEQKEITDEQIQSMIGFDWSPIQVLSFGANKLTNKTIDLLGEISDWENVNELYLFGNKITNITKIKFLSQLTKISFYDMPLDESSCTCMINTPFPKLKELYLDFDVSVREQCWKKIVESKLSNFPVLEDLHVDNPDTIPQETKEKLMQICQAKGVQCKFGNPNASMENCTIY